MESFFSLHSQHDDASAVIDECIDGLEAAPGNCNFGFLYATDTLSNAYRELYDRCRERTGIANWIGAVGNSVISSGGEHYDTPAASIMLAQFDERDVMMLPALGTDADVEAIPADTFATHFGIVHGDPYHENTPDIIQSLQSRLENGFLAGGITSSRNLQIQLAGDIYSKCISGALFSENVTVATSLSQGCSPIGARHLVTRAEENVALTLDGKPSLDVMMNDLEVKNLNGLRQKMDDVYTGLCIPGSDRSDYSVRNIVGIEADHRVFAINDYLNEGDELMFCSRNRQSAEDDMRDMLQKLAARIERPPRGGVYITCVGRGREQFEGDSAEVRMIFDELGDFPLTGFFANGEIHHGRLYGYTGVLTLFL